MESTEESRRAYLELLFTAPDLEKYISGVILFEETWGQNTADDTLFPKFLAKKENVQLAQEALIKRAQSDSLGKTKKIKLLQAKYLNLLKLTKT